MNRIDIEDYYVYIRMWCPPFEAEKPKVPFFVRRLDPEGGGVLQWTLTEDFDEATLFRSEKIAKRVVKAVDRFRHRIDRGWYYEVVRVTEEVVDHNLPPSKAEDEKEDAA